MEIINKNFLTVVKVYEFIKPDLHKIYHINDNCSIECHNEYFHTFKYRFLYDDKFTIIRNIEMVNLTFSDKEMNLYLFKVKLKVARENGFILYRINILTVRNYCNLSNINIYYYLKFRIPIPMCQRQFFTIISQN